MCVSEAISTCEVSGAAAGSSDFCRIFSRKLASFYRLAFLLTTSHSQAEQCTLASLDQALKVDGIPHTAAETWSKHLVIKNALQMVRVEVGVREPTVLRGGTSRDEFTAWPFDSIISLQPLERFVFVLSVMERIPDSECSRLFDCAVSEIGPARIRALESISRVGVPGREQSATPAHKPVM